MTCPACNIPLSIKDVHLDTFHAMCVWLYRNWKPLDVFENNYICMDMCMFQCMQVFNSVRRD